MYNLIIYAYLLGVAIYSRFNEKVRKMWRGERNAFSVLAQSVEQDQRYVWFHAASLGEFEQGRPLMEQLRREHPELKILLTFFSPSGYEVRKNYNGADIICYLPLDTPRNARRFLRLIRPEAAFFIKYEFWYNYLHILKHRQVPVYSVSSIFRDGQVFFRWYGKQYGRVLKCFIHFYVQNERSRELLATLGLTNATVTGDTRFDRVLQIRDAAIDVEPITHFRQASAGKKIMIVGSSWESDEDVYLPYFVQHREWRLVIAPHVVSTERVGRLQKRLQDLGLTSMTLSQIGDIATNGNGYEKLDATTFPQTDVVIIDSYGLLSSIYHYADVTYVGGGFGVGIHNVLEAAVWGKPVIFGPNNQKFQEAQELKQHGGSEISTADDFARLMDGYADATLLARHSQAAQAYVASKAGATRLILSHANFTIS